MLDLIFSLLLLLHIKRNDAAIRHFGCILCHFKTKTLPFKFEVRDSGCITPLVKLPQPRPRVISMFINRLTEVSNQMMLHCKISCTSKTATMQLIPKATKFRSSNRNIKIEMHTVYGFRCIAVEKHICRNRIIYLFARNSKANLPQLFNKKECQRDLD